MSETSISSSPSKSESTIYKARLKRRTKRSKIDPSVQLTSDQEAKPDLFRSLLTNFYNDSEDEPTKNAALENNSLLEHPAILRNFKPFELEKSLAVADHIFVQQSIPNKANIFPETQEFVTCTNLAQSNNKLQSCLINKGEQNRQNESLIITESELISCCHQAEKILQNSESNEQDTTLHELTPKKKHDVVLVNSILEDFSQSPLTEKQIITKFSCQYTPEFRLRRLPVKNYSRKRKKCTRVNLTQRFAEPKAIHSSEYDEDISCCSSLSVQEDDTFCENSNNQSIATTSNNTERLCENLLNLTEYFTQNELKQSLEDQQPRDLLYLTEEDQQSRDDLDFSNENNDITAALHKNSYLLDNILILRSKCNYELRNDSYDSLDDFNGFTSTPVSKPCDIPHSNNSNQKEDNTFLDDWNDDNCHDIFACINTENVLRQNNIHITNNERNNALDDLTYKCTNKDQTFIVPKLTNLNPGLGNLLTFQTASSQPIQLSNLPDLLNCDNKALHKDENIFENPEDYEWNDDCDLLLNFQTPISFKENIVTNTQQKLPTLPEVCQHKQDAPCTSKLADLGFKTAAGKNVRITHKGQAAVQKLLNEFAIEMNNNQNYEEELKKIKCKVYEKTHNLKTESASLSVNKQLSEDKTLQMVTEMSTEFYEKDFEARSLEAFSLKSKSSEMPTKIQISTKNVLEEFVDIPSEDFLTDIECIENACNAKGDPQNNEDTLNTKTDHLNIGFQTANGKQVSIPRNEKQIVENLLKEFNTDVDIEKDLNDIKTKIQIKNKVLLKPNHYAKNDEDCAARLLLEPQRSDLNTNMNEGFHTANGKEISISAAAKQRAEIFFKKCVSNLDIETCEDDLKNLKSKVINKNKIMRSKPLSLQCDEDIVRQNLNEKTDLSNRSHQLDEDSATCSLNGKPNTTLIQVPISTKAKQAVANLYTDMNPAIGVEDSEKYLKDIKIDEDAPSSELTNHKRKMSIDNSDIETPNKTPAVKILKSNLQSSKSSLVEQSLKSPLTSATRPIIVRKNLLSLTKKRKNKGNASNKPREEVSEIHSDLNAGTATPTKFGVFIKSKEPAPETPNLKEFLSNASLTSTPRVNKKFQSPSQTFEDSDLKPIIWKNDSSVCNKTENNSSYATKFSESSTSNISCNSPNLSAKERIDRLKMYGKAPDVAPILIETNHNCRPSGLRRTRSMLKNPEN